MKSTFAPPSRPRALPEWAFDHIAAGILSGEYRPGDRLRDNEISTKLGVSRSPVREALQSLSRIGIVEISPSRFTRVVDFEDGQHRDVVRYAGRLAAMALSEALPTLDRNERRHLSTAALRVSASIDDQDRSATVDAFLTLLSEQLTNRVQRMHLADIRLGVRCGVRFGRPEPVDRARLRAICTALADGIGNGDTVRAAPATRALFETLA